MSQHDMRMVQAEYKIAIIKALTLYRKFKIRTIIAAAIAIVGAGIDLIFFSRGTVSFVLAWLYGGALGYAISTWKAYRTMEEDPFFGYLIHVNNHFNGGRVPQQRTAEEEAEHQRMVDQQYESPGFAPATTGT